MVMKNVQHAFKGAVLVLALVACADSAREQEPSAAGSEPSSILKQPLALVTDADLAQLEAMPEPVVENSDGLNLKAPIAITGYNNQASLNGPEIKILAPPLNAAISNPMMVHVEFASRDPGTKVNMDSFKLTYKKLWGIDLTDRVQDYIQGASIKAPEVELPEGRHTLEIYIEDSEANVSTRLITVEVASN